MSELDAVEEEANFWPSNDDDEIDPHEVSLFIGGKEFVFDGVGDPDGQSVYGQLRIARTQLQAEIDDPKGAGRIPGMSTKRTLAFLNKRLGVLNWLIANIVPRPPEGTLSQGSPQEISYPIPQ